MSVPLITILKVLVPLLVFLQIILCGPFVRFVLNRLFRKYVNISFKGPGLILPLLLFKARDIRVLAPGNPERDRVYFEADSLSLRIELFFLFIGRVRIKRLLLEKPMLDYINRQHSHLKNHLLPGRHRVEIKDMAIKHGQVYVYDETMTPELKFHLYEIELENCDLDVGTSIDLFFRTARGTARLGSGTIEIGTSRGHGFIKVWGMTWGEITSMGELPFMNGKLALEAFHSGGAAGREVHGNLGFIAASDDSHQKNLRIKELSQVIPFEFDINWNNYRLTFDLGLQKLLEGILHSARPGGITSGLLPGIKGLFEIFKKQEN